jgi:chorismate-pyruvate lyase
VGHPAIELARPASEAGAAQVEICSFEELVSPFEIPTPRYEIIPVDQMPAQAARLLNHRGHMTVTLEQQLDCPLALEVLEQRHEEPHYSRRIRLTGVDSGELALFGVMRFDFRACSKATRKEILAGVTPLGRILIASGALRTVHLHRLIKLPEVASTLERFGGGCRVHPAPAGGADEALWGRLASIHCDGLPAVDLVEILAPHL